MNWILRQPNEVPRNFASRMDIAAAASARRNFEDGRYLNIAVRIPVEFNWLHRGGDVQRVLGLGDSDWAVADYLK